MFPCFGFWGTLLDSSLKLLALLAIDCCFDKSKCINTSVVTVYLQKMHIFAMVNLACELRSATTSIFCAYFLYFIFIGTLQNNLMYAFKIILCWLSKMKPHLITVVQSFAVIVFQFLLHFSNNQTSILYTTIVYYRIEQKCK